MKAAVHANRWSAVYWVRVHREDWHGARINRVRVDREDWHGVRIYRKHWTRVQPRRRQPTGCQSDKEW
jgi:hypothetical protein